MLGKCLILKKQQKKKQKKNEEQESKLISRVFRNVLKAFKSLFMQSSRCFLGRNLI